MEKKIGCVVMAAGLSRRFGGDKLAQNIKGIPMIQRALEAVPTEELAAVVVVSGRRAVLELAGEFGFQGIFHPDPASGAASTVRLGLEALPPCDGALFMVADQPLLRRETVGHLVRRWREDPGFIAALGHHGVRGNPCLFPADLFSELMALEGDRGGAAVIRRHLDRLFLVEASAEELTDVDDPDALRQINC